MGKACSCKRNCRRSLEVTIYKKADTFRSVGFLSVINQSLRFELNLYDIRLRIRKIKIAPIEYIIINVKSTSFPKRLRLVANAFSASAANIPWSASSPASACIPYRPGSAGWKRVAAPFPLTTVSTSMPCFPWWMPGPVSSS